MGEGERVAFVQLEIIRGSLPSSAAIREYREGGSGSKSRAVISKMAGLLNDNSQASLPASFHCCRLKKKKKKTQKKPKTNTIKQAEKITKCDLF